VRLARIPASFSTTRDALHAIAEHVVAPVRYATDGRIGLVPTMGGFGTPVLERSRCVRVEGTALVVEADGTTRRAPLTTLATAAEAAGAALGALANVYPPATPCDPDATLAIDPDAAAVLAAWLAFADGLLAELREAHVAARPSPAYLWPEHFDLACDLGDAEAGTRANYGASPGDATIAEPYLYVGPWDDARRTGDLATYGFGAAIGYAALQAAPDPHTAGSAFFARQAAELLGSVA
jgi:hypothetical protein